jgi:hypothetical protein
MGACHSSTVSAWYTPLYASLHITCPCRCIRLRRRHPLHQYITRVKVCVYEIILKNHLQQRMKPTVGQLKTQLGGGRSGWRRVGEERVRSG